MAFEDIEYIIVLLYRYNNIFRALHFRTLNVFIERENDIGHYRRYQAKEILKTGWFTQLEFS